MNTHDEIKKRLDELENAWSINTDGTTWLITQLRASLEREAELFKTSTGPGGEMQQEINALEKDLSDSNKKIITLEAIIIALGLKDNISKKLAAEAAFEEGT